MKKNIKNTLLYSTTILSLVAGATTIALSNSSSLIETKNINNNLRAASPNNSKKDALINPDELFYMNPTLTPDSHPIIEGGVINQANVDLWKLFSTNAKAINIPGSLPEDIKKIIKKLQDMSGVIDKTIELNQFLITSKDEFVNGNPNWNEGILGSKDEFWETNIKPVVIEKWGVPENMSEIEGINEIKNNLLILSGIVTGTKIQTLEASTNFGERNLSDASGNNTKKNDIGSVAGTGYKQLIKIAEISPSKTGNYALKFGIKVGVAGTTRKGTIYIKNDTNQLQSASNAAALKSSLDIFGRWDGNVDFTQDPTLKSFDNFIIQKNGNNFEVLVRLKEGESISNVHFVDTIEGSEAVVATPDKFGILNVQATDNTTFLSKSGVDTNATKLVNDINSADIVTSIQFFGNSLSSNPTTGNGILDNRTLEYYQGPDSTVTLGLNYAEKTELSGPNEYDYNPIVLFENGVATKKQINLSLQSSSTEATTLKVNDGSGDSDKYDLFADIKDTILKNNKGVTNDNFEDASKIKLESKLHEASKITKQTLKYSHDFYAVGNMGDGFSYNGSDTTKVFKGIVITDPTQKIFFEKPESFQDNSTKDLTSEISALETVDERVQVLKILGEVYNQFSKTNSGDFSGKTFNQIGDVAIYESTNGKTATKKTINVSGSANSIYQTLTQNWTNLSNIIQTVFGLSAEKNRYNGTDVATAEKVISNYLAKAGEFTLNSAEIEKIVTKSIETVKKASGSITSSTTYSSLSGDVKFSLAQDVATLIGLQFGTIVTEFESKANMVAYQAIKKMIENETDKTFTIIKPASEILEVYEPQGSLAGMKLIKYKENAWKEMTNGTSHLKDSISSLLDVIYFNNDYPNDLIRIGDSIFEDQDKITFNSLTKDNLLSFTADDVNMVRNKVSLYSKLVSTFAGEKYSIQASIEKMISEGIKLQEKDVITAFRTAVTNLGSADANRHINELPDSTSVSTHYMDDIVSGTNIIIALKWKLAQITKGNVSLYSNQISRNQANAISSVDLQKAINTILSTNPQSSASELAIWSNIINEQFNFLELSSSLSGRGNNQALENMISQITKDENILASRNIQSIEGAVQLIQKIIEQLWWIVVILAGAGVLVASTVGITTKSRQVKLSSRPVLKWLLIAGVVLGIMAIVLAVLFGPVAIL